MGYAWPVITSVSGKLLAVDGLRATLAPAGMDALTLEVLVPAYVGVRLAASVGQSVTLVTIFVLEGQGQGTSLEPRLLGFPAAQDRAFFEVLTSVNGIGNRKALRALALHPGAVARAIVDQDAKLLATLPEIGKRMAERLITELSGKVDAFLVADQGLAAGGASAGSGAGVGAVEPKAGAGWRNGGAGPVATGPAADAIATLMALGQTRSEAEEAVSRTLAKAKKEQRTLASVEQIVEAVFGR